MNTEWTAQKNYYSDWEVVDDSGTLIAIVRYDGNIRDAESAAHAIAEVPSMLHALKLVLTRPDVEPRCAIRSYIRSIIAKVPESIIAKLTEELEDDDCDGN